MPYFLRFLTLFGVLYTLSLFPTFRHINPPIMFPLSHMFAHFFVHSCTFACIQTFWCGFLHFCKPLPTFTCIYSRWHALVYSGVHLCIFFVLLMLSKMSVLVSQNVCFVTKLEEYLKLPNFILLFLCLPFFNLTELNKAFTVITLNKIKH